MRGSGIISNAFGYCLYGFRKRQMGNRKSSCFRKSLTEFMKKTRKKSNNRNFICKKITGKVNEKPNDFQEGIL